MLARGPQPHAIPRLFAKAGGADGRMPIGCSKTGGKEGRPWGLRESEFGKWLRLTRERRDHVVTTLTAAGIDWFWETQIDLAKYESDEAFNNLEKHEVDQKHGQEHDLRRAIDVCRPWTTSREKDFASDNPTNGCCQTNDVQKADFFTNEVITNRLVLWLLCGATKAHLVILFIELKDDTIGVPGEDIEIGRYSFQAVEACNRALEIIKFVQQGSAPIEAEGNNEVDVYQDILSMEQVAKGSKSRSIFAIVGQAMMASGDFWKPKFEKACAHAASMKDHIPSLKKYMKGLEEITDKTTLEQALPAINSALEQIPYYSKVCGVEVVKRMEEMTVAKGLALCEALLSRITNTVSGSTGQGESNADVIKGFGTELKSHIDMLTEISKVCRLYDSVRRMKQRMEATNASCSVLHVDKSAKENLEQYLTGKTTLEECKAGLIALGKYEPKEGDALPQQALAVYNKLIQDFVGENGFGSKYQEYNALYQYLVPVLPLGDQQTAKACHACIQIAFKSIECGEKIDKAMEVGGSPSKSTVFQRNKDEMSRQILAWNRAKTPPAGDVGKQVHAKCADVMDQVIRADAAHNKETLAGTTDKLTAAIDRVSNIILFEMAVAYVNDAESFSKIDDVIGHKDQDAISRIDSSNWEHIIVELSEEETSKQFFRPHFT